MANELIKKDYQLESVNNDAIASPFGQLRRQYHNGEYWMCAQDACNVLGYKNALKESSTIVNRKLDKADTTKCLTSSSGQGRYMTYINQHGFMKLCLSSTLENAKEIQEWLVAKFFNSENQLQLTNGDIKAIARDPNFISEVRDAIKNEESKISLIKLARFVDCEDGILLCDFAKALNVKSLGPKAIYDYFQDKGYIYKKKNHNGWYPKQRYVDRGWMKLSLSTFQKPDGSVHKTAVVKLTGTGVLNFSVKILAEREPLCITKPPIQLMK